MKAAGVLLALAAALTLQTTLAGLTIGGRIPVNLVLVAVVYVALAFGPVTGMFAGTAGGLIQDALAGGVIGIGSLSKTVVGFFVGVLGAQFIVSQLLPRFVMFVGATIVHEACFQALYALTEGHRMSFNLTAVLTQAAVNGGVGVFAFKLVEEGPNLLQRRHARRSNTITSRRY
jgi:rod shape-determining protein MreD